MIDIETQLAFVKTEKQKHQDAITTLDAIEATLTDKVSAQLASLPDLITTNARLVEEKADALNQVAALQDEKTQLEKTNDTLQADNARITASEVSIDKAII